MPAGGAARWSTTPDGARLRVFTWGEGRRGTVFLFNGRTEFVEKYFEVVGELRERGFSVVSLDWRGQGLSARMLPDRRKGHIDDFSTFDRDLAHVMAGRRCGASTSCTCRPTAATSCCAPRRRTGRCTRAACSLWGSAPATASTRANPARSTRGSRCGRGASYSPGGGPKAADETAFADNILTHDEKRYALLQVLLRAEPELGLGSATVGWLHAAFRTIALTSARSWLAEIRTPVLICEATEDALIDGASLHRAVVGMPAGELAIMRGARHEILIETDPVRAQFWEVFDRFIGNLEKR